VGLFAEDPPRAVLILRVQATSYFFRVSVKAANGEDPPDVSTFSIVHGHVSF
jgi:hypothetical protein